MKIFDFITFSLVLIFITILFVNYSTQTIEQDQHADKSYYGSFTINQGEFEDEHGQGLSIVRRKRYTGILDYLRERRKKRNTTYTLAIHMKIWLNIELTKKVERKEGSDYTPNEEQPIEYETNTDEGNPEKKIVYKNAEFRNLCDDPMFTAVDSSLDGSEIVIFKGEKFYVMENLRYGSGNLIASGLTSELFPKFDPKGFTSMVTIKEGPMRGYIFAFYNNQERAGWTPVGYTRAKNVNEFSKKSLSTLPKKGFQAALHNRNIEKPLLIGLNGEMVYYYKTNNKTFTKVKEVKHNLSDEKFPSGITAGFSMPNGYIYLFRDKQYCVRELNFEVRTKGVYCDVWLDSKIFLGCYGQYPPPYSMEEDVENYSGLKSESLCDNFEGLSLEKSVDDLTVMAFSGDNYWNIKHFPEKPDIKAQPSAAEKWEGLMSSPDAILIVQEGELLRGSLFAFKEGTYSQWSPNGKPLEKNKKIEKFNAIIHNSDILNPMAVAFAENSVYYYNTDSTSLKLNKTLVYTQTEENWPKGITTGLTLNTDNIFLFKGDTYCLREWKCSDKETNCCKEWLSAKELFNCSSST